VKKFSDANADFFDQLDRWGTFILANLLWVFMTLPIVTIPAATAGLFAVISKGVRGKRSQVFQDFFEAVRQHWRTSTLLGLLDAAVVALIMLNWSIFPLMEMSNPLAILSRSMTVFAGVMLLAVNLYAWSLLALLDMPLKMLLKTSLQLVFLHPLWSIGLMIAAALPIVLSLVILPGAVIVLFTFSCSAYIVNWGAWRIIRQRLSEDERQQVMGTN
jgi:uncharacterized membrane protein YesL